jgi:hypothetical protein
VCSRNRNSHRTRSWLAPCLAMGLLIARAGWGAEDGPPPAPLSWSNIVAAVAAARQEPEAAVAEARKALIGQTAVLPVAFYQEETDRARQKHRLYIHREAGFTFLLYARGATRIPAEGWAGSFTGTLSRIEFLERDMADRRLYQIELQVRDKGQP